MIDLTLDYHSHILPGCDHGSDGLETSLKQLQMAKAIGIRTICATSHFYPHKESIESFLERRNRCAAELFPHLKQDGPKVFLGAEVLICEGMERMEGLERLCRQGTNELLLEMPFYKWTDQLWETLFHLLELENIQIVMAHVDRYPAEDIQVLIDEGVPLQLNAECLTKPLRRKRYLDWIKRGYIHYLGSDIHMEGSGYQEYEKARKLIQKHTGGRGK